MKEQSPGGLRRRPLGCAGIEDDMRLWKLSCSLALPLPISYSKGDNLLSISMSAELDLGRQHRRPSRVCNVLAQPKQCPMVSLQILLAGFFAT